jgi:hypothetical protein
MYLPAKAALPIEAWCWGLLLMNRDKNGAQSPSRATGSDGDKVTARRYGIRARYCSNADGRFGPSRRRQCGLQACDVGPGSLGAKAGFALRVALADLVSPSRAIFDGLLKMDRFRFAVVSGCRDSIVAHRTAFRVHCCFYATSFGYRRNSRNCLKKDQSRGHPRRMRHEGRRMVRVGRTKLCAQHSFDGYGLNKASSRVQFALG